VAKGTLGIELDAPFRIGPLMVAELALRYAGVRFPIDLSGGVARFRHRRGALSRVAVEVRPLDLMAWIARRLRGLLSEATPDLVIAPVEAGALVGMRSGDAALAFDVVVAPGERDLRLVPERARGIAIGAPPHVLALRALAAMCQPMGKVIGGAVVIPDAVAALVRHVLPEAGARAPSVAGVRWEPVGAEVGGFRREANADAPPPALQTRCVRALELADLAADADEASFRGDLDEARGLYMALLERAPRHREVSERIAWIDLLAGDRPESALSTLVDAVAATDAGLLGGELLAAVGDLDGSLSALSQVAHVEPYSALAALTWLRVADLAEDLDVRLRALDQAVVRAPTLEKARWARLEARLDVADIRGARADAEHLEAAARGSEARHAVWRRAADAFLDRGFVADASALFERALRYVPDSAASVAGLARSLRAAGQARRALDLFARAAAMEARSGRAAHAIELELARCLAEVADDRPAAIARVRRIPPDALESFEARLLEGRWRSELGDLAGASTALGRLRDAVEIAPSVDEDRAGFLAALLVEAAEIEERERADLVSAQRHLGVALRLRPRDRAIAAAFRRVAGEVVRAAKAGMPQEIARGPVRATAAAVRPPPPPPPPPPSPPPLRADIISEPPVDLDIDAPEANPGDELLAERLTDRVRADPNDHGAAMELADVLERLGRDLDLLSLLSARLDEGDEEARRDVAPRRRAVLLRLAAQARAEGRSSEAELYEMMAASDPD
jgi:tetratricopeptide (TPR) repeat protein